MRNDARILVTGAGGMVGGALVRRLRTLGFEHVLGPTRAELPLDDARAVERYFEQTRPEHVFMLAARVGGIAANMADPVGFLSDNLRITVNLFDACHRFPPAKSFFLGSSCIYPREAPQPMREEALLTGPFEPTNEGYAIAKVAGIRLAQAHWAQYGLRTLCAMPCNVYGPGDHFDFARAHVLSSLVRRFVDAADQGAPSVTLWGTGVARREFIHVDDLVNALLFLMDRYDSPQIINIGPGEDITIRQLGELIASVVGYRGDVAWDPSMPDGMPRKCMETARLEALGFRCAVSLREGVERLVTEYRVAKAGGEIK